MAATLPTRRPPQQKSVSPQRVAQYDPYAHQLGSLSENIHRLLTERECAIYDRGLTDYHRRRHIRAFVECLSLVLNTNQKRQLLIPIRDSYIKPSDLHKFNQLALELGLAAPLKKKKADTKDGVKKIEIKRNPDGEWGFNIRGGSEHGIGIFVSSVERGSNAEKAGLKAGDQIKKANDLNCESVTHQEAVSMMRNSKKLQLWVLSRGHVPTSRMAHKVYNWVDPQGRPTSPPPDPFEVQEQISSSSRQLMNQPDERKVTMMIENGQELGISIRGGAEHGLGIYVSAVEERSVAEAYGVNVGDQILEVNGISLLGIVHTDAAHALRAQPCMVLKLKDVGKLPHSRITTLGKTQWHSTGSSRTLPPKGSRSPVFTTGYGTQMMLSDQETSFQVRGMMNEVARSVLTSQELNTFNYYVDQYDQKALSIDDLVTPMLHLLNTPEKLQLLSEMHVVIKPRDLQRFNELTVHKALAVKKAGMYHGVPGEPNERSFTGNASSHKQHSTPKSKGPVKRSVEAQVHAEEPSHFQINPYENEDHLHDSSSDDGGRDKVPQKLSPKHPVFHAPPPPSSAPTHSSHSEAKDTSQSPEDTWSATLNETSMMSPPPKGGATASADSSINISEIEDRVRSETEARLRQQFEEQQRKLIDEQQRRLKQEQAELEEKIRREAEESMKRKLREKEEALARMTEKSQDKSEDRAQLEEELKRDLEEKIWKEAEEHLRVELEEKMQRELEAAKSEKEEGDSGASSQAREEQIRREMEKKYKRDFEEKIRREQEKWKRKEEEERRKQEQEAKARREAEIARLEAEEQAKIELEDRIRKEAEASARAEYEARLQHETEERARLAAEVKARKAMEERMEKERVEREKEDRERERQREREREQERKNKEKERQLASTKSAATNKQPPQTARGVRDAAEEEDDEDSEAEEEPSSPQQMTAEEQEEQRMLEVQRRKRLQEQKEEQRREEAQKRALAAEKAKKDEELAKKRELARKREENIRKLEEERKQKEAEARQKREEERKKKQQMDAEEKQSTLDRDRQLQSKKKQEEEAKKQRDRAEAERIRKQKEQEQQGRGEASNRLAKMGGKQVLPSGAAKNGKKKQALSPKSKAAAVEEERNKAEEMLEKKLREKKEAANAGNNLGPSFSYAGYDNLRGELKHVLVTKVVRKLGIAIDGGANTKQKAVIIREISPEGCAGQTAPELKVDQQLLEIEGQSLHGLRHKEVVMCIKHAFEGELGKVIDFTVLDPFN